MPAKKKAAASAAPEDPKAAKKAKQAASRKAADESWAINRAERERTARDLEARQQQVINERAKVKPDPEGDIDARMAALEADHKRMGAR